MTLTPLRDIGNGVIVLKRDEDTSPRTRRSRGRGRRSTTLSGGEAQRVKLATELIPRENSGTLYILDEPTTGPHFADTRKLLEVVQRLVDRANTVLTIEHNMHVIECADRPIDLGPEGGDGGGADRGGGVAGAGGGSRGVAHGADFEGLPEAGGYTLTMICGLIFAVLLQERVDRYGDPLPKGAVARLGTVQLRQGSWTTALAYSPDGRILASAALDGAVSLWDPETGRERRRLKESGVDVRCVAFSADGARVAAGDDGGNVRIWTVADGAEEVKAQVGPRGILTIAFSPDGKAIVWGDEGGGLSLWDIASREERVRIGEQAEGVGFARFTSDGARLFTAGGDGAIRWWKASNGEAVGPQIGVEELNAVALAPDGSRVATGSARGIDVWNASTGEKQFSLDEGPGTAVAFSPDGKMIAAGIDTRTIKLWDVESKRQLFEREIRGRGIAGLTFSPDGMTLASGGYSTIRLWDVPSGRDRFERRGHEAWVGSVEFSPDGATIATAGGDAKIRVWDWKQSREREPVFDHLSWTSSLAYSADGTRLACGGIPRARVWDVVSGKKRHDLPGRTECVAFSPDGETIATGGDDALRLWDARTGEQLRTLEAPNVTAAAFSPDGGRVAAVIRTGIQFWELADGRESFRIETGRQGVRSLNFSRDGRLLMTGAQGGTVALWDVGSGRRILELPKSDLEPAAALSPDGRLVATAVGGEAVVWETATGAEVRRFRGHRGEMLWSDFSPDGTLVATGSGDTTVLVWDLTQTNDSRSLDELWEGLASDDAVRAFDALNAMAARGDEATLFLGNRLSPASAEEAARLISLLDDEDPDARERAMRDLIAAEAWEEIRGAAKKAGSPEVKTRLEWILKQYESPMPASPGLRRRLRAIQVLERIGGHEANEILRALGAGPR